MTNDLYVYIIFRSNGIPCYVGKGSGGRWTKHVNRSHNKHLTNIYNKSGGDLPVIKVREGLTDLEAIETEIALIAAIGRDAMGGPLVNLTDGGDGTRGAKMTNEWRIHRSKKASELWATSEYRDVMCVKKIGNKNSKKPHKLTDAWRSELTEKMRGNTHTLGFNMPDTAREKMSARWADPKWRADMMASRDASGMYSPEAVARRVAKRQANQPPKVVREKRTPARFAGKRHSDEAKAKISISSSRPRKPLTQEHKDKLAALARSRNGHPHTAESKAKIAAAHLGKRRT